METPPSRNDKGKGNWKIRRRFMFVTIAFCMATISYILHTKLDTSPAETAMFMAFSTIITTLGAYVFSATWEDNTTRSILSLEKDKDE